MRIMAPIIPPEREPIALLLCVTDCVGAGALVDEGDAAPPEGDPAVAVAEPPAAVFDAVRVPAVFTDPAALTVPPADPTEPPAEPPADPAVPVAVAVPLGHMVFDCWPGRPSSAAKDINPQTLRSPVPTGVDDGSGPALPLVSTCSLMNCALETS